MSSVPSCMRKIAAGAGAAFGLLVVLSLSDSAVAQRRASAPAAQAPACFDSCAAQCRSIGGSNGNCARTCYGRCSGVNGDIENRH